ncbi:cytosolic sulfotransferase 5-like [Chenopodium quinoa]|uniref:Sulfotransferase n=1 Tax=Chenopodium quinoa TaxID=63459 RepID=A0A803MMU9_CHEQI|nr:cytosolic sulfotransferase 5-like [Chenopodium quinoa]
MAISESINTKSQEKSDDEIKELQLSLPKQTWHAWPMYLYQGLWCLSFVFEGIIAFKTHFRAHDSDIILASHPKTGTTWLKSLIFAIVNRNKISNDFTQHQFSSKNPHELIQQLEIKVYQKVNGEQPSLSNLALPRLFGTHIPYYSLPDSIKTSKCRIVYVCRNPLDTFISHWHFNQHFEACKGVNKPDFDMMEKYVEMFCSGVSPWGPYEDHVLSYWKESKKNPENVLFMEYEGLKKDPRDHLKRLAEFVGCPFSEEEVKGNVIDEIIELCSIKSLKEMEVNKSGKIEPSIENKAFFRKGEVGDWANYLTPKMVKQFKELLEKLKVAGFSFAYYQMNS